MNRIPFILLTTSLLLFNSPDLWAQNGDHIISVTTRGEVELPADIIQFNINLNAEADSPQQAYELHTEREKVLVKLLDTYQIGEENIRFQPVSIRKNYRDNYRPGDSRERTVVYHTSQQVILRLKDFNAYEEIQVTLIENEFDNFSGSFLSSQREEGEESALRKAIGNARRKAEIIAKESGVRLGGIRQIRYGESQVFPAMEQEMMARAADSQSLMKFDQTVVVQASIRIDFFILQ
ncbi:MAG: SIMPL domain-containing protein [Balneolaceae bacterium]|nr:SIMPL domain-containing protein [Balneolaceae bacterium]